MSETRLMGGPARLFAVAFVVAATSGLGIGGLAGTAAQASPPDGEAPVHMAPSAGIAHQYIVVLKGALPIKPTEPSERAARAEDAGVASSVKATPLFVYDAGIMGFAADLTDTQLSGLRHSPQVEYVEQDARVEISATQTSAPWDLDRIDQPSPALNGTYNYSSTGAGVTVYIIDTGIQADHPDFGSRAHNDYDALGGNGSDCNGHGTHVAGIVGGTSYGVAKLATLVGVRVLDCNGVGTASSVIAGVDWVTAHHVADKSVANMSLGSGGATAVDDAVNHLIESGVFVSVAAGNSNQSACNFSPAACLPRSRPPQVTPLTTKRPSRITAHALTPTHPGAASPAIGSGAGRRQSAAPQWPRQ